MVTQAGDNHHISPQKKIIVKICSRHSSRKEQSLKWIPLEEGECPLKKNIIKEFWQVEGKAIRRLVASQGLSVFNHYLIIIIIFASEPRQRWRLFFFDNRVMSFWLECSNQKSSSSKYTNDLKLSRQLKEEVTREQLQEVATMLN